MDADEHTVFVSFGSLNLKDSTYLTFLEHVLQRAGGIRGGWRFQRSLIDTRFEVGAAACIAGRELNVRSGLLGYGRALVRRKNLGLEHVEAIRGRRGGPNFVSAGIGGGETNQISDGGCSIISGGIASGRGFLQQNTFLAILLAGTEKIRNGGAVLFHVCDIALNPVGTEIGAGHDLFEIEDHAQIARRASGGHGLGPPLLCFDGAVLTTGHELDRASKEILSRGKNQIIAVDGKGHFTLGLGIAPNVKGDTSCAACLEFRARLPKRGLHRASRRSFRNVKKLQLPDVVERQGALRTCYLRQKIHVRRQAGRGGELLASALQTQEKARAGIDFVVLALYPACVLRRRVPVTD